MGEKKYAIADFYGYGQYGYHSEYYGGFYFFNSTSSVYFDNRKCPEIVEPAFKKISIAKKESPAGDKIVVPLYLVEEDGIWREYFTGTKIRFYDFHSKRNEKGGIMRELVFGGSSSSWINYRSPKQFADEISKYSEEEIQDMAGQFLRLCNDAAAWSKSYVRALERVKQKKLEEEQEEARTSEALERGIGQYSNVPLVNTTTTAANNAAVNTATSISSSGRNSQNTTSSGCLTQILMVLMLVLSVWWVFQ